MYERVGFCTEWMASSPEQEHVANGKRLSAHCDEARTLTSVERVVFLATVDSDGRPHPVIVRKQRDQRRPHDVEYGEIGPVMQDVHTSRRGGERVDESPVAYGPFKHRPHCQPRIVLAHCVLTFRYQLVQVHDTTSNKVK